MKKVILVALFLIFIVVAMLLSQTKKGGIPGWMIGAGVGFFVIALNLPGFNKLVRWKKKGQEGKKDSKR